MSPILSKLYCDKLTFVFESRSPSTVLINTGSSSLSTSNKIRLRQFQFPCLTPIKVFPDWQCQEPLLHRHVNISPLCIFGKKLRDARRLESRLEVHADESRHMVTSRMEDEGRQRYPSFVFLLRRQRLLRHAALGSRRDLRISALMDARRRLASRRKQVRNAARAPVFSTASWLATKPGLRC